MYSYQKNRFLFFVHFRFLLFPLGVQLAPSTLTLKQTLSEFGTDLGDRRKIHQNPTKYISVASGPLHGVELKIKKKNTRNNQSAENVEVHLNFLLHTKYTYI